MNSNTIATSAAECNQSAVSVVQQIILAAMVVVGMVIWILGVNTPEYQVSRALLRAKHSFDHPIVWYFDNNDIVVMTATEIPKKRGPNQLSAKIVRHPLASLFSNQLVDGDEAATVLIDELQRSAQTTESIRRYERAAYGVLVAVFGPLSPISGVITVLLPMIFLIVFKRLNRVSFMLLLAAQATVACSPFLVGLMMV